MKKYDKMLEYLMTKLSISDRILLKLFKGYTYRIIRKGIDIGFNWEDKNVNENEKKSTICQPKHNKKK